MTTLTEQEKKFLGLMEQVDKQSLWGLAISDVVGNPEPAKVRRLITSLQSQAADCESVMLSIIGESGMRQLQNL